VQRKVSYTRFAVGGVASAVLGVVVGLFSVPIQIHYLGTIVYGQWVLLSSVGAIIAMFGVGMPQAALKYISEDPDGNLRTYGSLAILLSMLQAIVMLVLSLVLKPHIFNIASLKDTNSVSTAFFLLTIAWNVTILSNVLSSIIFALSKHPVVYIVSTVGMLLIFSTQMIALMMGKGIIGLAFVVMSHSVIRAVFYIQYLGRVFRQRAHIIRTKNDHETKLRVIKTVRFAYFQFIGQLAFGLIYSVDNFFAARFSGIDQMIYYSLRLKIFQAIETSIANPFWNFIPLISSKFKNGILSDIRSLVLRVNLISMSIISVIAVFFVVFIDPSLHLWTGKAIPNDLPLDILLSYLLIVEQYMNIISVVNSGLDLKANSYITRVVTIESLFNFILTYVLAQHLGVIGVLIGTIIPRTLSMLISSRYMGKRLAFGTTEMLTSVAKPLFLPLISIVPFIYLSRWIVDLPDLWFILIVFIMLVLMSVLQTFIVLDLYKSEARVRLVLYMHPRVTRLGNFMNGILNLRG